ARNTAMQYYRQAKLWLLDQFPQHRAAFEARLLKIETEPRIRKPNISIDAGNVLFVRFIRMKISEEQGLPLFPGSVGNNHVATRSNV
ncbi:Hypothetical protein PHPALM_7670, partial [Phytophthora palmivora]